jgi:glutamyl-tRNA reductase
MPVFCIGISHRTAPVERRERYALAQEAIPAALARLRARAGITEAVWLSTCNRVELYAVADTAAEAEVRGGFLAHGRDGAATPDEGLYAFGEPRSLEHLFRVACGLDSMVLGETEILGQLKKAYDLALQHGHTGGRLNKAFQRAFNVAKHVRTATAIQRGGTSVASVAVELAERIFDGFDHRRVLLLGAGDTGEKVARAFISRGVEQVLIHNRTAARAETLVGELGPKARHCPEWSAEGAAIDVVVSSTSSTGFVLDAAGVSGLQRERRHRPLLLIDLAVPRDIDPVVVNLDGVYLYNVDDLQSIANHHLQQREAEVARCEAIIREKARALVEGRRGPDGSPSETAPAAA